MNQKEIISLLSREQKFKRVFLQLGNQRNIPHDIILLIYNFLRYQSQKDTEIIKNYHLTNLYEITLLGKSNNNIDIHSDEFKSKLPINRGPEWGIKSCFHAAERFMPIAGPGLVRWTHSLSTRHAVVCLHLNIIGEEDYLYEKDNDNNQYKCATFKTKLNYINKSPLYEIKEDYDEYINNNKPINYSIFIDNYGEGNWMNQINNYY